MALDEDKRKRSLASIAQSGQYPGAIPSLSALLPSGSNASFTDSEIDPSKPYFGGQRQAASYPQPAAPLANTVSLLSPQQKAKAALVAPVTSSLAAFNNEQDRAPGYQPRRSNVETVGPSVAVQPALPAAGASPLANTVQLLSPAQRQQAATLNAPASYQTPGPDINADKGWRYSGDFDFADQAALRFAGRQGDGKKVAALSAALAAPQVQGRDNAIAQSKIGLDAANIGLTNAQATDVSALTPSKVGLNNAEIGLRGAQGQEALARGQQALATAGRTTALTPAEIAKMGAETGETQQRGALYGAQANAANIDADTKSLLQPGQLQAQTIANKISGFDVKTKERFDQLGQQLATEQDPQKRAALSESMAALVGKPGEYKAIHLPGGTDATGVKQPDRSLIYNERTGDYKEVHLTGGATAAPANHIAALKANPSLAKDFDAKYGAGAAARALGQ